MYYIYHTMTEAQKRRTWRLFSLGGLMALVCGSALLAATAFWADPMGLSPDGFPWTPANGYGLACGVLFALSPLGLSLFLWAVANYRIERMVRRQQDRITRLDGVIRLWCAIFFLVGIVFVGRMALLGVKAIFYGWPTGQVRSIFLQDEHIVEVAFSDDGNLILARSDKGRPTTWDVWRGKQVPVPAAMPKCLTAARSCQHYNRDHLRLSTPDGQTALEVILPYERGQYREVVVRDGQGKELRRLIGHEQAVRALAISADGKRALTGSEDKTVRLWNVSTCKELLKLQGHRQSVTCVLFAPNGHTAFAGAKDGSIRAWDLQNGSELQAMGKQHRHDEVNFLSISADGQRLLSTGKLDKGRNGNLCVWNVATATPLSEFSSQRYTSADGQTALSRDGRWAVTTDLGWIQLWRLEREE